MSSIVIASILILIVVLISMALISVNNKHRKKESEKLVAQFSEITEGKKLVFSHTEIMENFIVGLDELRKKFIVLNKAGDKYDFQLVDLKEVKSCSKKKIYRTVNMGTLKNERFESLLEKIVLEFDYSDNRPPLQVPFYESGKTHLLEMAELDEKAGSWVTILTKTINSRLKSTA
jgi:hypothetical protein